MQKSHKYRREVQHIQTKLAILDQEIGPGLCTYLLRHPIGMTPVLCSSWEGLRGADARIGLVQSALWDETQAKLSQQGGMELFLLDENYLSPYQPADLLIQQLYRLAQELHVHLPGALRVLHHEKEVVAVCSPHGYDLQTGFAIVYSLLRAEQLRTLYLDFTYYNGFFDSSDKNIGDLFYELQKQTRPLNEVLGLMVRSLGSLEYLSPVRVQMDLEDLTGEDLTQLLQRLLQDSEYDLIVINLPVRSDFLRAAYDSCSCMYSLQREGVLYDRIQTRLLEDLGLVRGQTEHTSLQIVPMPSISGSFSMDSAMYEELLFGEMAQFIQNKVLKQQNGDEAT